MKTENRRSVENMAAKLTLVVSNPDVNEEKIIASIRPLDRDVAPSDGFREEMKLLLLQLPLTRRRPRRDRAA